MATAQSTSLPQTCKAALLYEYGQDFRIESIPTPQPVHGTVVVKIEAAPIYGPWKETWTSKNGGSYPTPFVPGGQAIGRVAAVGPDTTTLKIGQLVMTEYFIRARDDPNGVQFLRSSSTFGNTHAHNLASDLHRHGPFAEYQIVAHENCHPLDEKLFLGSSADGSLGYKLPQLGVLAWHAICYSGLREIDLKAGETVVILPATGVFGSCAVEAASAMGARVIAGGRNAASLKKLADGVPNVKTVQLTGDISADAAAITKIHGPVDAYLDISPPSMPNMNHISAGLASLATYGRAVLMGIPSGDVPINYGLCVLKSLTIKGRLMYERDVFRDLLKLAATGLLRLDKIDVTEFKLDDWKKAVDFAAESHSWRNLTSISP